jgi:hypothetical protein
VYFKDAKWDRLFDVGDSIVIERFSTLLSGNMWLDTQTFQVMAINDETGDVNLYNNQASQWAMTNYATAPLYGHNLLFATGSLEKKTPEEQTAVFDKIKETLPEQAQTQNEQVQVISVPSLPPTQVKRPRGRPKGSKNRPKICLPIAICSISRGMRNTLTFLINSRFMARCGAREVCTCGRVRLGSRVPKRRV